MTTPPIILVPGFWLGAWAWDEVADLLRADGHDVTALTLPGLESADADRSSITLSDHANAIADAVTAAGRPVVLAVHSGTGFSGYVASGRVPDRIAGVGYGDCAPRMPEVAVYVHRNSSTPDVGNVTVTSSSAWTPHRRSMSWPGTLKLCARVPPLCSSIVTVVPGWP